MSETWYPEAVKLHITTQEFTVSRSGYPITSEVKHISAGSDSRGWLQNANNGSSVHFLIRIENGKAVVYQFMPIEWAAWGNGRFSRNNPYSPPWIRDFVNSQPDTPAGRDKVSRFLLGHTISTEHEGVTPTAALFTGPMLDATIALSKWLADKVPTYIRDREHVIGHYQIDHIDRAFCPGGPGGKFFPFDTVVAALNAPADVTFPETNVTVKADFYQFWQQNGGLPIFGYPIRVEKDMALPNSTTIRVQSFERARFERHQDGIKLGLVEAERLILTHE